MNHTRGTKMRKLVACMALAVAAAIPATLGLGAGLAHADEIQLGSTSVGALASVPGGSVSAGVGSAGGIVGLFNAAAL